MDTLTVFVIVPAGFGLALLMEIGGPKADLSGASIEELILLSRERFVAKRARQLPMGPHHRHSIGPSDALASHDLANDGLKRAVYGAPGCGIFGTTLILSALRLSVVASSRAVTHHPVVSS